MDKRIRSALAGAAAVSLLIPIGAARASAGSATEYCFAKHAVNPGQWEGTYARVAPDGSCDASSGSAMVSRLTAAPAVTGEVAHITITWTFYDGQGDLAFETAQEGVLKLGSGDVVLHGTVTEGERLGARTQDRGSPTDALGSYAGVMRVLG